MTAATVASVTATRHRVRLPRPWGPEVTHAHFVRAEVTTSDGWSGHGWTWLPQIGPAAAHRLVAEDCRDGLVGGPVHPVPAWDRLWTHLHEAGSGGLTTIAMAAVDTALWDLHLSALGTDLAGALGSRRDSVEAYGSGVNLHLDLDQLVAQAERWVAAGHDAVKIKVGRPDPVDDLARVAAVRSVIGPRRRLMVDANQRWDLLTARRVLDALAPFDLDWVEEPLLSDDLAGYVALRAATPVPVALGENHHTVHQYRRLLESGACDIVQPDVVRVGGVTPFLRIAELARTFGVTVHPHHLPELSAQLVMTLPGPSMVERIEDASPGTLGVLAEPQGAVADGPRYRRQPVVGLGADLDPAAPGLEEVTE